MVIANVEKRTTNFHQNKKAMNHIPTKLTEKEFNKYIFPNLSKAKRGFVSLIPLYLIFNGILYKVYTGCQWKELPTEKFKDGSTGKTLTYQAFYYHFRKWSNDDSMLNLFKASIIYIELHLDFSELNLDGTHTIAKKGGELVDYQHRKRAKTSNILPLTDKVGNIIGFMPLTAGNHNDAYQLKSRLTRLFKWLKMLSLDFFGAFFNADAGFDTKQARKVCFNYGVIPNIKINPRNQKKTKRGRKRRFNSTIYKNRFTCERTFAWVDKFRSALIRFDKKGKLFPCS